MQPLLRRVRYGSHGTAHPLQPRTLSFDGSGPKKQPVACIHTKILFNSKRSRAQRDFFCCRTKSTGRPSRSSLFLGFRNSGGFAPGGRLLKSPRAEVAFLTPYSRRISISRLNTTLGLDIFTCAECKLSPLIRLHSPDVHHACTPGQCPFILKPTVRNILLPSPRGEHCCLSYRTGQFQEAEGRYFEGGPEKWALMRERV
ncbi:hypothetical protein V8F06_002439 [Rhypophila decipiens]